MPFAISLNIVEDIEIMIIIDFKPNKKILLEHTTSNTLQTRRNDFVNKSKSA